MEQVVRTVPRVEYRSCESGERKLRNKKKNNGFHDQLGCCSARNLWESGRKLGERCQKRECCIAILCWNEGHARAGGKQVYSEWGGFKRASRHER